MMTLYTRVLHVLAASAMALACGLIGAQPLVPMPDSGSSTFGDWSFSWEIGNAHDEGLVLKNVRWKSIKVLHKASVLSLKFVYKIWRDFRGYHRQSWSRRKVLATHCEQHVAADRKLTHFKG